MRTERDKKLGLPIYPQDEDTPTPELKEEKWELRGIKDESAQYSILGESEYIEVPKSLVDFLLVTQREEIKREIEKEKYADNTLEGQWFVGFNDGLDKCLTIISKRE